MAKIVSNQITFLDVTDQQKLSIYLVSNLPTVQIRSKEIYNPSWVDSPLKIELKAFLESEDISNNSSLSIKWYEQDGNGTKKEIDEKNKILTINTNKLGDSTSKMLTYICEVTHDSYGSATSQLTYTLIDEHEGVAGESAVTFYVYAPYGNVFSNHSGSLEAKAVAYLGSSSLNLLPKQYVGIDHFYNVVAQTEPEYSAQFLAFEYIEEEVEVVYNMQVGTVLCEQAKVEEETKEENPNTGNGIITIVTVASIISMLAIITFTKKRLNY